MKRMFAAFLLFVFILQVQAAPLIYKFSKVVIDTEQKNFVEVGTFDALKYKQIRVVLKKRNVRTTKYKDIGMFHAVSLEDGEEAFFANSNDGSIVIDSPPPKIRIKVIDDGNYTLYVYGTQ